VSQTITHEGIVVGVEGENVTVRFVRNSACSQCHAKALCSGSTSESESRTVVAKSYGLPYYVGEEVRFTVASGVAWSAVRWAFMVPTLLVLASLFLAVHLWHSEMMACLVTFVVLAVYYFVFWLNRKRLEKRVEFVLARI